MGSACGPLATGTVDFGAESLSAKGGAGPGSIARQIRCPG